MSKVRNPKEKKTLSYTRECRNAYGESSKGSRKSIRKNKRCSVKAERAVLRGLRELECRRMDEDSVGMVEVMLLAKSKHKRLGGFKKYSDQPLISHIECQRSNRAVRIGRKQRFKQSHHIEEVIG